MRTHKKISEKALQALVNMNRSLNNGDFEFMGSQFWTSEIKSTFNRGEGIASDFFDTRNIASHNLYY